MKNRTTLAVLASAITGVQVGAAITATRFVAGEISPASLAFLRYAVGVACLIPVIALTRSSAPTVPQPPPPLAGEVASEASGRGLTGDESS